MTTPPLMRLPSLSLRRLLLRLLVIGTLAHGVLGTVPVGAQPVLPAGTRVRVFTDPLAVFPGMPERGQLTGTVVFSDPSELRLDTEPPPRRIELPVAGLRRIDVSRGRPNRRLSGGMIGGLVSGAVFVGAVCAFSDGSCDVGENVGGFLAYYAVGAVPGVLIGARIGARRRGPERWETVWTARQ
ncbi:MAG: hypothetical protein ACYC2G_07890 [Gemmatimonadaceae bacterium]